MDIERLLKELNTIRPDEAYAAESRKVLLQKLGGRSFPAHTTSDGAGFWSSFRAILVTRSALVAEATTLVALVAVLGIYVNRSSDEQLVAQANEVNSSIQVKLDEIKYLLDKPAPLGPEETKNVTAFLSEAETALKEATAEIQNDNLEDSLAKMKAAEEAFSKIEGIAKAKQ